MSEEEENEVRKRKLEMINKIPSRASNDLFNCCYCNKGLPRYKMTGVPTNQSIREKWVEILGKQFANNLKKAKYSFICRTHFEGNPEHRLNYQLPVRMEKDKEEKEDENEEFGEEDEEENGIRMNEEIPHFNCFVANDSEKQTEKVNNFETVAKLNEVRDVPSTSKNPKINGKVDSEDHQEVRNKRKIDSNSEKSSKREKLGKGKISIGIHNLEKNKKRMNQENEEKFEEVEKQPESNVTLLNAPENDDEIEIIFQQTTIREVFFPRVLEEMQNKDTHEKQSINNQNNEKSGELNIEHDREFSRKETEIRVKIEPTQLPMPNTLIKNSIKEENLEDEVQIINDQSSSMDFVPEINCRFCKIKIRCINQSGGYSTKP
ncbi:unnamed protein product [Caenorhabditis angaria]|uniref:THAP-type domain-containing protein n=1 Tax=Caenorhabditis angaria TaxID=860376 RepID=A0A9P1I4U6_9PELO|nr:unnamed protein product [Caenorhabditis angaria]